MDHIFIDTSIFEADNFLEGRRIKQILKLAEEGQIKIILPAITFRETKNRAVKNIKEAISRYNKYRKDTRVLRNIDSLDGRFELIDEQACINEFIETFENALKTANCIFTNYPTINIKEIFEKYFGDEFPFSRGEKKHEFPDAFALLSVEMWCKEKGKKCYIFSNDKDLLSYKSKNLIIVPSHEEYLDKKLRQIEAKNKRIEFATIKYEQNKAKLEDEVGSWLSSELEDTQTYYQQTDQVIHDVNIKTIEVSLSDFQIVSINDHEIIMETEADIFYHVVVEMDDKDSGYYDGEDKVWIYTNTEIDVIEDRQVIPVQLRIDIPMVGDQYMEIEIDEINHGGELKL